jgi:hypothetical protein
MTTEKIISKVLLIAKKILGQLSAASSLCIEKSDAMSNGGGVPEAGVSIPCVHDTWGFRFRKSFFLYFDFNLFAFSCLIFKVNAEMAESPAITELSAIEQPHPICQSHVDCSD